MYWMKCLLIHLLVASIHSTDVSKYRLPSGVVPNSYSIKLQPFIDSGNFTGEVRIDVAVKKSVKSIYCHGSGLHISELYLNDEGSDSVGYKLEPKYELISIFYKNGSNIDPGNFDIHVKYNGSLVHSDKMGLFKGSYGNKTHPEYLVVSDFQATYARRAYPCFDEPALKAVFNVTIIAPNSTYVALSNMPNVKTIKTESGMAYMFESSMPMSTYLTSFVMTKLNCVRSTKRYNGRNITYSTYIPNSQAEKDPFVLKFTSKVVEYFTNFTSQPFPSTKIDFIEYNKQFTATEYWGLTTFRTGLLNPTADLFDKRQIAIVVAHELTHYWFGNLVTNRWWNDIWLQEGFAQYLSHKVTDDIFNDTNVDDYPFDYTQRVFEKDRTERFVNPIIQNVTSPEEICVQFNDITYLKAGSIIRLLEYLMGDTFTKLIRTYFERFKFESATTSNFMSIIDSLGIKNSNLKEFLQTWLYQNRYPIITIVEDHKNKQYVLTQKSASIYRNTDTNSSFGYKWTIPIIYNTDINPNPTTIWFRKDADRVTIPMGREKYIKLNYNYMGIYFTNYTSKMWKQLSNNIGKISSIEQTQLLYEAQNMFYADLENCDVGFELMKNIKLESKQLSPFTEFIYRLKRNLKFDPIATKLLRTFYRHRTKHNGKIFSADDTTTKTEKATESIIHNETRNKSLHERFLKCAEWMKNNL